MTYKEYYKNLIEEESLLSRKFQNIFEELKGEKGFLEQSELVIYLSLKEKSQHLIKKRMKIGDLISSEKVKPNEEIEFNELIFKPSENE